jgi:hypothetical protein
MQDITTTSPTRCPEDERPGIELLRQILCWMRAARSRRTGAQSAQLGDRFPAPDRAMTALRDLLGELR